jgi:hypothetical protein
MFAVAVPASAATVAAAPYAQNCQDQRTAVATARITLNDARNTYQADKLASKPSTQLDIDLDHISKAQRAFDTAQNRLADCEGNHNPRPIVTVGNYPVPRNQAERDHLLQVCEDRGRALGLTVGVLTEDCRRAVPPCPVPPPCVQCLPIPVPLPAPTETETPAAPPVATAPPVVAGPTTIIEQPAPTIVMPAPSGGEIVQPPSGAPSAGSIDPADRYIGS